MDSASDITTQNMSSRKWFLRGMRDGIPICMGYFAVSFALGVAARNVGMDAAQATIMSALLVASAGEFAAITLIGASAGVIEMVLTTIVINLRYLLMSCSLTQKLAPNIRPAHRLCLAYCITDEIFGLSVSVPGYLCPYYTYGITFISVAGWCAGTLIGAIAGNILPVAAANALSVAMYGMFLAIIIPPGRQDHFILGLVAISMGASWLFTVLPVISTIGSGFQTIILTIVIAGIAAVVRPHDEEPAADVAAEVQARVASPAGTGSSDATQDHGASKAGAPDVSNDVQHSDREEVHA